MVLFLASIADSNNVLTDLHIWSVLYELLNLKSIINITKAQIEIFVEKELKKSWETKRW